MQTAEGVDKACFQKRREFRALFVRKARVAHIGARILQIDRLMSHVEIAAHHHWFRIALRAIRQDTLLKTLAYLAKDIVPVHAMIDTR